VHAWVHDRGGDPNGTRLNWPRCCQCSRLSAVETDVLLAVLRRLRAVLHLDRQGTDVRLPHCRKFALSGPHVKAASSAVVADAVVHDIDHPDVVDVRDVGRVDVGDRTVVHEAVAVPIATVETLAGVAVAIGNTAVKADVRTPVAVVPAIAAAKEAPPGRRP
jgi:hypothetical protein